MPVCREKPPALATHSQPGSVRAAQYGILLGLYGKLDDAERHLLRALEIQPDLQSAADGLRLVRELLREGKKPNE